MQAVKLRIEPITRQGASEKVVHRLLALVKAGDLGPGDRLPSERELADRFQVSRPTIREAVRALAVLGVVKTRHGGGIFVSAMEASDILGPLSFFLTLERMDVDHLYQARLVIEGEIAALACAAASAADIAELDKLIDEQATRTGQPARYRVLDTKFHARLSEIAGNPFLARAASSMNVLGMEFRKIASESEAVIGLSIEDHRAILVAFRARDPEAARRAMQTHMRNVLRTTRDAIAAQRRAREEGRQA
ncbi:MAG: FadR family transcriptional regulator [Methylobacteriaceae bacterium]|nr:FadR family transcriptional regulator [Methylobacteriaceae bacterium]